MAMASTMAFSIGLPDTLARFIAVRVSSRIGPSSSYEPR
jgi:hypothetical protein